MQRAFSIDYRVFNCRLCCLTSFHFFATTEAADAVGLEWGCIIRPGQARAGAGAGKTGRVQWAALLGRQYLTWTVTWRWRWRQILNCQRRVKQARESANNFHCLLQQLLLLLLFALLLLFLCSCRVFGILQFHYNITVSPMAIAININS